jgi:hypothetical protein
VAPTSAWSAHRTVGSPPYAFYNRFQVAVVCVLLSRTAVHEELFLCEI